MALTDLNDKLRPFRELLDEIDAVATESVTTGQLLVERKQQLAAVNAELDQALARRSDLLAKLAAEETTTAQALESLKAQVQTAHRGADQALRDLSLRRQVVEIEVENAIGAAKAEYAALHERLAEETAASQERLNALNAELGKTEKRLTAILNG